MDDRTEALEPFIRDAAGAERAHVVRIDKMSGGAIQENWLLDVQIDGGPFDGLLHAVLRKDARSQVGFSHSRVREFAIISAAFAAGVTVPEPLWLCDNDDFIGGKFFVSRRVDGVAAGHRLVRDETLGGGRTALTTQLGAELARIHSIPPGETELAFLKMPAGNPAADLIETYQTALDEISTPHPVLQWALAWLKIHQPESRQIVLCHRDYRTGNYMVNRKGVTGILDWEFTGWGDPLEDIGWFCAPCWRFGATDREAGGIGTRDDFYAGYELESGRRIDREQVGYWEVMATLRWAVIALQQTERHQSGEESSLELALTGHILPELEMDILKMTGETL